MGRLEEQGRDGLRGCDEELRRARSAAQAKIRSMMASASRPNTPNHRFRLCLCERKEEVQLIEQKKLIQKEKGKKSSIFASPLPWRTSHHSA